MSSRLAIAFVISTAALVAVAGPATAHNHAKAPNTRIVSGPSGTTDDSTPTFGFRSTARRSKFKCRLDGGALARCTSPHTLPPVSVGPHVFSVFAINKAGTKDRTPAERAFQYAAPVGPTPDTTPPDTAIDSGPADLTADNDPAFAFSSEPGATFRCSLDDGTAAPCTSPAAFTDLADGPHTFSVTACDAAGNCDPSPAQRTFTVDTTPPSVQITSKPSANAASANPSFSFSVSDGTAECQIDGGAFAACSSPRNYTGLAQGSHTFTVRSTDAAGNVGSDTWTWTVDTIPPTVTITAGPPNPNASTNASFSFSVSGGTVQCQLDSGLFAACSSPKSYTGLTQGSHTFTVRSTDAAGNVGSDSRTWTVDTVAPVPPTGLTVTYPSGTPHFTWTSSGDTDHNTCYYNVGASPASENSATVINPCTSPLDLPGLSSGTTYTFSVYSVDAAGNKSGSLSIHFTPP